MAWASKTGPKRFNVGTGPPPKGGNHCAHTQLHLACCLPHMLDHPHPKPRLRTNLRGRPPNYVSSNDLGSPAEQEGGPGFPSAASLVSVA
jgi:hypothetical protein